MTAQENNKMIESLPLVWVSYSHHAPAVFIQDKDETAKVVERNSMESKSAKVNIRVIPQGFRAALDSCGARIYNLLREYAVLQDGGNKYAIPIKLWNKVETEITENIKEYNLAKARLLEAAASGELESIKQRDLQDKYYLVGAHTVDQLNGMFWLDYRLSAKLESESVKTALEDFSAEFRATLERQIRDDERKTATEQAEAIGGKALTEIFDTLKIVAEKLGGKDVDGLKLKNIREKIARVVDILPHFNVTNDKRVSDLIEGIQKHLGGFEESEVREDDALRKVYADFAKTTLEANGVPVPPPVERKPKADAGKAEVSEAPVEETKAEEAPVAAPLAGAFD